MNDDGVSTTILSAAGGARREAMLEELLGSMQAVHRRRRRRRAALATVLTLAGAAGLSVLAVPRPSSGPRGVATVGPVEAPPPAPRAVEVEMIVTDASIVDRCAVVASGRTSMLDDGALLAALAAIDRPTGLVRRGNRVWLTSDVTGADPG